MFASKDLFFTRPSGYQISRSVRLRSSASAYFNRTPASTTNRQKWTWSGWVKLGVIGTTQILFVGGQDASNYTNIYFTGASAGTLELYSITGGVQAGYYYTTSLFRDPSAWYHIVFSVDTTATTKLTLYVNGVSQPLTISTAMASSYNTWINTANAHKIGNNQTSGNYFDGYMTEVNFIDGQALTPSSFGETNAVTGVWQPKKFSGTYGTNGFYLNFSDNSSNTATTIGKDYSGNGNNWTPNNISVTAGVTYDSMVDSPTVGATSSNYAVLNPLKKPSTSTITDGNLNVAWTVTGGEQPASFAQSSGKWYWEQTQNAGVAAPGIILDTAVPSANSITQGYHYYGGNGQFYTATTGVAYGATFTTGDVIGVALDLDNNQITFYKNNTSQGTKTIAAGSYTPDFASAGTITINANFGQRPFTYTPPTGFVALNTQNLPTPTISNGANYMAATAFTGTNTLQTVSNAVNGVSFQPDFFWLKDRQAIANHQLFNSIVGAGTALASNSTSAEFASGAVYSITSSGFTGNVGSTNNFIAWQWKASGSTVSNTSGSITSTVSAGATQGFSVVTYTGTGANATVGHGLGVAPNMVIVKERSAVRGWPVYHSSLTSATYYVDLQTTQAQTSGATIWNSTAPTSSVFSIGTDTGTNQSTGTYVAYCFSAVSGYSAFGSYTGNGSTDGPFIYTGFRPRWFLVKVTSGTTGSWHLIDTSRSPYNQVGVALYPDSSAAESSDFASDILSNGLKIRNTQAEINQSGATYIYAAFAEVPLKFSLGR